MKTTTMPVPSSPINHPPQGGSTQPLAPPPVLVPTTGA
jgi:hypothetical protein